MGTEASRRHSRGVQFVLKGGTSAYDYRELSSDGSMTKTFECSGDREGFIQAGTLLEVQENFWDKRIVKHCQVAFPHPHKTQTKNKGQQLQAVMVSCYV